MIHRYTVFGNPIAQSKSPEIHALFAEQTGRQIEYTRTLADDHNFADAVRSFVELDARGFNITAPFKQDVLALCDSLSAEAEKANAVNTVKIEKNGVLSGHNTDGSGLLMDLRENLALTLNSTRILIAGAGGATRGILMPLLLHAPDQLVIANRTVNKAYELARDFSDCGEITACSYEDIPQGSYDLVINATSASLSDQCPPLPRHCVRESTIAYDLSYGKETEFMRWAREAGSTRCVDGTGMLLEQAADAFFIWENIRPKTRTILSKFRKL